MGIAILVIFSVGVYIVLRTIARLAIGYYKPRTKTVEVAQAPSIDPAVLPEVSNVSETTEVPDASGLAIFDIPTFLRRGMPYPVLAEKKIKRARKAKQAIALA